MYVIVICRAQVGGTNKKVKVDIKTDRCTNRQTELAIAKIAE